MEAALKPWLSRGVAFVGASAIVMAPISPITPMAAPAMVDVRAPVAAISPDIQLAALDIPYILTLPIIRQSFKSWAENWAVYLAGFAKAGVGAVESLLSIPGVTVEIIQEIFALDFVGAFNTFTGAIRDSVVAIGEPLLDSLIWRNQKYLLVEAALESAVPQAIIDVANGFLAAGNVVVTSLLEGTQNLVGAFLTFNLGNIVDAFLAGTRNFFVALGEGAGSIVDGIEAAQRGITEAMRTTPPESPFLNLDVPAVESAAGLAGARTAGTSATFTTLTLDQPLADVGEPEVVEPVVVDELPAADDDLIITTEGETDDAETLDGDLAPESPVEPAADEVLDDDVVDEDVLDDETDPVKAADDLVTPKDTLKDLKDTLKNDHKVDPSTPTTAKDTGPAADSGSDKDSDAGADSDSKAAAAA
jgi:hypothetical protein